MKKTFTINISGIIFHIDEDAFDLLNSYITSLRNHFTEEDGRDEIIADIESRIAELLQEKISDAKQVITNEDIIDVIKLLGQPFEMDTESDDKKAAAKKGPAAYRRLFRDPDRRLIAGVCAGIAAYLKTDPIIIRILFLVAFLASGVGLLVYIIVWIALPEAVTTAQKLQMQGKPVNIETIEETIKAEFEVVKSKFDKYANEAKESYLKPDSGCAGTDSHCLWPGAWHHYRPCIAHGRACARDLIWSAFPGLGWNIIYR
jgi:phage shock protein PspC (stress-responsive transcriptional regulator)